VDSQIHRAGVHAIRSLHLRLPVKQRISFALDLARVFDDEFAENHCPPSLASKNSAVRRSFADSFARFVSFAKLTAERNERIGEPARSAMRRQWQPLLHDFQPRFALL
jgi:hypothetical protein